MTNRKGAFGILFCGFALVIFGCISQQKTTKNESTAINPYFARFPADTSVTKIEHGKWVVRNEPLTPPFTKLEALENFWRVWEDKSEQDAVKDLHGPELLAAIGKHYGLGTPDYDNNGLPLGLMQIDVPNEHGVQEKWVTTNCYACHSNKINDHIVWGAWNSRFDYQMMIVDNLRLLEKTYGLAKDTLVKKLPLQLSQTSGRLNLIKGLSFSASVRDKDMNLRAPVDIGKVLAMTDNDQGANPWWNTKLKNRLYWDGWMSSQAELHSSDFLGIVSKIGGGDTGIPQITVALPPDKIKAALPDVADSYSYHMSTEAPKYPFEINRDLAMEGEKVFNSQSCVQCHGSYGANQKYPDKFIPISTVGTDPVRYQNVPNVFLDWYRGVPSGLIQTTSDGQPMHVDVGQQDGYLAPPLNGVWASAPYFHNKSVPTLREVLRPIERPSIWKLVDESFDMYDQQKVGLKVERYSRIPDGITEWQRRKYFDSSASGASVRGHGYGVVLTDHQVDAVIEYLKTL